MNRTVVAMCGAAALLVLAVPAQAMNSVVVESRSFSPGQTACTVGVYVTNDLPILAMELALELRTLSGGAYIVPGNLGNGLNPVGRVHNSPLGPADPDGMWPEAIIINSRYGTAIPVHDTLPANTVCPRPRDPFTTWYVSSPIDYVSPDAFLFAAVSVGDPGIGELIELEPGTDPTGVPSYRIVCNVGNAVGMFIIDTTCISPLNRTTMIALGEFEGSFVEVFPAFQPGLIGVGVQPSLAVAMDIDPGHCPNGLNASRGQKNARAQIDVAVLGSPQVNVQQLNPASIRLQGVVPLDWTYDDVTAPSSEDCGRERPDGYHDLVLTFSEADLIAALGQNAGHNNSYVLHLTGSTSSGLPITGSDQVIVHGGNKPSATFLEPKTFGVENFPNPFNAATVIRYNLAAPGAVRLDIINVLGQRVATLADGYETEGPHEVVWDSRDANGVAVSSGVYFYRLQSGQEVINRKMILLK